MILNLTQRLIKLFVLLLALGCTINVYAQPANNECSGAADISSLFGQAEGAPQTSAIYDNTTATHEASDPTIGYECFFEQEIDTSVAILENTLWFTFTGDGGQYDIRTTECTSSNYILDGDTQIAVYEGTCGALNPVIGGCNEDSADATGGNYFAGVTIQTSVGATYYIMIDGFNLEGTLSTGEFCVEVTLDALVSCTEASGGTATGINEVCFNDTTSFTIDGTIVPTFPIAGFFWAVSTADISGTSDPFSEDSYLGGIQDTQNPTEVFAPLFINDGTQLPVGTYFFTAITYGDGGVDANGGLDLSVACVFATQSIEVSLLADGTYSAMTVETSASPDNGGNSGEATVTATGGSGNYTYLWSDGATTATASGLTHGTYTVTVSDGTTCGTFVETVVVENLTGVEELTNLSGIQMFPNPAIDVTTIQYDFNDNMELNIRVMDILGQTIIERNEGNVRSGVVELNVTNFEKGIYLVEFSDGVDKVTRKLIVNKP